MDIHFAFEQKNEGRRHQNQSGHIVVSTSHLRLISLGILRIIFVTLEKPVG